MLTYHMDMALNHPEAIMRLHLSFLACKHAVSNNNNKQQRPSASAMPITVNDGWLLKKP
eukprot:m.17483 g.17483  ORF g.17483 m.17483 type:complete len:59 (+) comp10673_c0_seq10:325-501(+)